MLGLDIGTSKVAAIICDLANRQDRLVFVEAARGDVERDPLRKAEDPKRAPRGRWPWQRKPEAAR